MENRETETITKEDVGTVDAATLVGEQTADTPGNDENKDGITGGQATADVHGDVLGI